MVGDLLRGGLDTVQAVVEPVDLCQELQSLRRRGQLATASTEKLEPHLFFETTDQVADSGLRDRHRRTGAHHAALAHDGPERLDLSQLECHGIAPTMNSNYDARDSHTRQESFDGRGCESQMIDQIITRKKILSNDQLCHADHGLRVRHLDVGHTAKCQEEYEPVRHVFRQVSCIDLGGTGRSATLLVQLGGDVL